jgi:thiol-disulfide isomerase/thioredoxin
MFSFRSPLPAWSGYSTLFLLGAILSSCAGNPRHGTEEVVSKTERPPALGTEEPASKAAGTPADGAEREQEPEPVTKPAVEVLMINGGGNRQINYQSHLLHLKQMNRLLLDSGFQAGRITIMSADGSDPDADLAVREQQLEADAWLLDGTELEGLLRPRVQFENSKIEGATLLPATPESLHQWFEQAVVRLKPRDTLCLYVTDHGTKNNDDLSNNRITLWGKNQYLDVSELRRLIARLDPDVRVVQLMSQCYSGSFAELMYRQPDDPLPSGKVCGFFSSTAERPAYGCYPENRNRENVGHSFRFIEALAAGRDFAGAHNEVLVSDDTPDVPLKTSDVYLESLLRESSRRRGQPLDSTIDGLLHEAWRDAAKWEPEIRLLDRISESFGYFSPRLLSELDRHAAALEEVSQAFDSYGKAWEAAYHAHNRENLTRFLADNPEWAKSANKVAIAKMNPESQSQMARNVVAALGNYSREDKAGMSLMELLRQKTEDTAKARYRMEVRRGIVLRLRSMLTSVAGRFYLEKHGTAAQRKAYEALLGCESFALAKPKISPPIGIMTRTFPSYDQELELGKTILPGWMGVQFKQVGDEVRNKLRLASGAVAVSSVLPDSPARNAGVEPGDIILGTPDEIFTGREQIREWIITAPIGVPQPLLIQRGEQRYQVSLTPMPEPVNWPDFPGSVKVGSTAPSLDKLRPYRGTLPVEEPCCTSYLLFFFATWCGPCKASLPELAAFEKERDTPVIAVTDEPSQKLDAFFSDHKGPFPPRVMTDELRYLFMAYGVNGIPTFVLVDQGRVRSITTGYRADKGLSLEGWSFR